MPGCSSDTRLAVPLQMMPAPTSLSPEFLAFRATTSALHSRSTDHPTGSAVDLVEETVQNLQINGLAQHDIELP
jgi:hypothetical protein